MNDMYNRTKSCTKFFDDEHATTMKKSNKP